MGEAARAMSDMGWLGGWEAVISASVPVYHILIIASGAAPETPARDTKE